MTIVLELIQVAGRVEAWTRAVSIIRIAFGVEAKDSCLERIISGSALSIVLERVEKLVFVWVVVHRWLASIEVRLHSVLGLVHWLLGAVEAVAAEQVESIRN